MKKRISIFVLALLLLPCIFMLSACGGNDNKSNNSSQSQKYSITFIVDEEIYAKIETSGNEYIQLPTSPTKNGYTFDGWFLDKTTYQNELKANTYANTKLNSNITVFAKFTYIENPILAESISLDKTQLNIAIGQTYSLSATILPSNATNKNITWSSSNQNVATISNGKITSIGVGQTTIKAQTSNGKFATCEVKVFDSSENVQVEVYIDNQKVDTLTTNFAMSYKITAPIKPEDITINPNSEKYFYGWFVDSNYQTPLTDDTVFTSNGKIYAKWINVYSNNFIYSVSKGKATITLFNNSQNLTVVVIPCYINSFPVETIGASAFINQTMLRNVIICNGIKTIEAGAFYSCNSMESISLPNTLETIECNAFENCEILEKITLPNSLQKIGANAFKNCTELKSVEFNSDGWWLANNIDYVFEKNIDTSNCAGNAQNLLTNEISKTWFNYELYTINYHLNDGQLPENAPLYFSEYIELKLVNATKKGYTFGGYYLDSDFTSQKVEKIEKGTTSFEVYAKWNIITYKIEYNLNGGTNNAQNPTKYNVEMDNLELLNPTKEYYNFVGWYRNGIHVQDIDTKRYENIYLTAKYTPIVYTISYELNGGTNNNSNPTTYTVETPTITLQPAIFENETVSRWYSEQTFETRITTIPKGSHGNIKLYARAGYNNDDLFNIENNVLTRINTSFFNEFDISTNITQIVIPNSITGISKGALSKFSSLEELTIPFVGGSPTENTYFGYIFGASSYSYNSNSVPSSLKKVTITTSIGNYAFYNCSGLTSITISNSVTSIGYEAFYNCDGLSSISIPSSVTSIRSSAFSWCNGLTSLEVEEGNEKYHSEGNCIIETNSKTLIVGCKNSIIPNDGSVTNIGNYAFYGCDSLTSITIPDSVKSIEEDAFYGCSSLTSVTIRANLTSIGEYAFYGCNSLTSITIPNSVTSIGDSAFKNCSSLEEITIPFVGGSPTNNTYFGYIFGASSYSYNSNSVPSSLRKVNITGGTSIGYSAFRDCSSLTTITILDSVTNIGRYAFFGCSSLTAITIPDSVTSIGSSAFSFCDELTSLKVEEGNEKYHSAGNCIIETNSKILIAGCKNSIIPNDGSVTNIGDSAFFDCSSLTSITIPNSVNSIEEDAFYGCSSLTTITIPDSVTSIGSCAFSGCSSLTSIVIPDSVKIIDNYAFNDCSNLTIYSESTSNPTGWSSYWNYSYRPVYWYSGTKPTKSGNYWHYVDGVVTKWE